MTQTWQTHCYHYTFSCGNIVSLSYLSNWHTGSLYDPICRFIYILDIYIEIFNGWWATCDLQDRHRRPIYINRIWSTKHCIRFSDINVPIGVLTDSYGYIGTSRRIYFIIYPDGDMTWLGRLTVSPRRDTDNHASEVTSYRPGRHILRLYWPIVTIWVLQTHIDTIGSIHNLYHPLSWRWYDFQCQLFSYDLS